MPSFNREGWRCFLYPFGSFATCDKNLLTSWKQQVPPIDDRWDLIDMCECNADYFFVQRTPSESVKETRPSSARKVSRISPFLSTQTISLSWLNTAV